MVLLYGMILTTAAKVGMRQQNYNVIDEVSLRVKAEDLHKVMQKNHIYSCIHVYSADVIFQMMSFLSSYQVKLLNRLKLDNS